MRYLVLEPRPLALPEYASAHQLLYSSLLFSTLLFPFASAMLSIPKLLQRAVSIMGDCKLPNADNEANIIAPRGRSALGYPPSAVRRNIMRISSLLSNSPGGIEKPTSPVPQRVIHTPTQPKIKRAAEALLSDFERQASSLSFDDLATQGSAEYKLHLTPSSLEPAWHLPSLRSEFRNAHSAHDVYRSLRDHGQDMTTLSILDGDFRIECSHPRRALEETSSHFKQLFHICDPAGVIVLQRQFTLRAFQDYTAWLYAGKIVPHPHMGKMYAIEAAAARLVEALHLGMLLDSRQYVLRAMYEFWELGWYLEKPEKFVDDIFWAAGDVTLHDGTTVPHGAKWLIVAIVAAHTEATGRRKLCYGLIPGLEFIKMFGLWHAEKGGKTGPLWGCEYPKSLEEACAGV